MVGNRYNYSLDIGEELEREKQREKEKKESDSEPEEMPEQEEPAEPEEMPEQEEPAEPAAPPDPLEEDVNEIIAKDIPVLRPKKRFFDNFMKYSVPVFLILLIMLGFWSLTKTADLPHLEKIASLAVQKQLQLGIAKKVAADWPGISVQEKARRAARLYASARNEADVKEEIAGLTKSLKAQYQMPGGLPYFFTPDDYFYYRLARNIVQNGHAGEILDGGKPFDNLRYPPFGVAVAGGLFPYFQAAVFKSTSIVADVSLEQVLFYLPVLIGIGSLIVFFFIVRRLFGSFFPAAFASLVLAIHPRFIRSNFAGLADTGSINLFLSLLCILFFVHALHAKGRMRFLFFGMIVVTLGIFKQFWSGWYYPLVLFVLFAVAMILLGLSRNALAGKRGAWIAISGTGIVLALLAWFAWVKSPKLLSYLGLQAQKSTFYPHGFELVQELKRSSLGEIFELAGGAILAILALAGVIMLVYRIIKSLNTATSTSDVFLLIWCIPLLIAGMLAYRFLVYAMPGFLAIAAFSANGVAQWLERIISGLDERPTKYVGKAIGGIIIGVLVLGTMWGGVSATAEILPLMNDGIAITAKSIAQQSQPDAIITTWWSLGYVWQAYAQRPVVMDGGSFASSRLWWLSQAFTTSDEHEMRDILRFLYCGGERTVNEEKNARGEQSAHDLAMSLVRNSSCTPPESFVIVTEDMLGQLPGIAAISEWDFATRTLPEPNNDAVERIFPCAQRGALLECGNNFVVNLSSLEANRNKKHPASVSVYTEKGRRVRAFDDAKTDFSLVVMKKSEGFVSFLIDETLADSMLVRMLASDPSLRFFEKLMIVDSPEIIVTYKVAWNGRNLTLQNLASPDANVSEISSLLAQTLKD